VLHHLGFFLFKLCGPAGGEQADVLTFKIQAKGDEGVTPPDGIIGDAFHPVDTQRGGKWLIDNAAGKDDKGAVVLGGGINDLDVAPVGVHAEEQVEASGMLRFEGGGKGRNAGGGIESDPLTCMDVFVFVGQRLGNRVDYDRLPTTLDEQITEQTFPAANICNPARLDVVDQPLVQELEAKSLHARRRAGINCQLDSLPVEGKDVLHVPSMIGGFQGYLFQAGEQPVGLQPGSIL